MGIVVNSGTGSGPTSLAAFDSALRDAGVANCNLLVLSSVIPAGSLVEVRKPVLKAKWGDRLYVVLAQERVIMPNKEGWAGLGWAQDPGTGEGLFVEHHGGSEQEVRQDIEDSLNSLYRGRNLEVPEIHMEVKGVTCKKEPVCAVVVAVYQAVAWNFI